MDIKLQKGVPYLPSKIVRPKKPSQIISKRNNYSLPSINGSQKQQKINVIRNQNDETKNQISNLKARINALKWQKLKYQKKKERHENQINFINTVRDRLSQQKQYKQEMQQKKGKDLQYLKQQVQALRQQRIKDRDLAKSAVTEKKILNAKNEREQQKLDEEQIAKFKTLELTENKMKAMGIKQQHSDIQQKLKSFNESRIVFAQQNHHDKIQRSLSQKQKMERILKKLKKQELKLMDTCKKSESDMLQTLYELQTLNPESRKRKSFSNKSVMLKLT